MRFLIVILLIILASCEKGADIENAKEYSKNGILFKYPGNWKVTGDSKLDDVRFIFVESPGAGIMRVEIYDHEDSFDLKEFVKLDIESLAGQASMVLGVENSELIMAAEKIIGREKLAGLMYEMDISVLGIEIPHITEVYKISNDEKAAYLSSQVATEDSHLVSGGFDLIFTSFQYQ